MDNIIIINNREYNLEKIYRKFKNDLTKDSKGDLYPYPKKDDEMINKKEFLNRLSDLNKILDTKGKFYDYKNKYDCLLCGQKNICTKRYYHNKVMWEDSLYHYVDKHDININSMFKNYLFTLKFDQMIDDITINRTKYNTKNKKLKKSDMMILKKIQKNNKNYVKLEANQLLVLDALMAHGGYNKKYFGKKGKNKKYSEHAGLLDFEKNTVKRIVVAGNTHRVDDGDDEIFLPMSFDDMLDYEYIFHTHPPTPKAGGRASGGILYEYPSISDIFHFIDHHNDGNVIGSLVVTPEGLYNIRKFDNDSKLIDIDEDDLFNKYQKIIRKNQRDAIKKYSTNFTQKTFFSKIAQEKKYIENINKFLEDYDLQIDYYPRTKDSAGDWFIDTVYLYFVDS